MLKREVAKVVKVINRVRVRISVIVRVTGTSTVTPGYMTDLSIPMDTLRGGFGGCHRATMDALRWGFGGCHRATMDALRWGFHVDYSGCAAWRGGFGGCHHASLDAIIRLISAIMDAALPSW